MPEVTTMITRSDADALIETQVANEILRVLLRNQKHYQCLEDYQT